MNQQSIGPYAVLSAVGDGGMGTVYRAVDPRFDRPVAIKVLHPHFARDPEVVERFKSEAVIQAKLNHPNIAAVYDFIADGALAMVMEYVDGETLEQAIASTGGRGLPPERASAILRQVLSAVGFAHEKGLVHRDLKPSNIMVQRFGGEEMVKVMDFGVAKILGSEKLRTATSAKIGTLAYMSPEHIRSPKHVDARSDIYSLGVVMYEALTGRLPYDADSEYGMMQKIVSEAIDWSLLPPGPVRDVIVRATAKEPAARFGSCEEARRTLVSASGHAAPQPPVNARASVSEPRRAAASAARAEWFVWAQERELGPYTLSEMSRWYLTGRITTAQLVRRATHSAWVSPLALPELAQVLTDLSTPLATVGTGRNGESRVDLLPGRLVVERPHKETMQVPLSQVTDVQSVDLGIVTRIWGVLFGLLGAVLTIAGLSTGEEGALLIGAPILLTAGGMYFLGHQARRPALRVRTNQRTELYCSFGDDTQVTPFIETANRRMRAYHAEAASPEHLASHHDPTGMS